MAITVTAAQVNEHIAHELWKGSDAFCLRLAPALQHYVREQARLGEKSMTAFINQVIAEHAIAQMK